MQYNTTQANTLQEKPYLFTRSENIAIGILSILYIVGTIGFFFNIHPYFVKLTPINLLISLLVVLIFHPSWNWRIVLFLLICPVVGFVVEMKGVETGAIFGTYQYGETLGFKYNDTPLSIGINWLLLSYCSAVLVSHFTSEKTHIILKALFASAVMVGLDVLIEPVAIKTDMWSWPPDNDIPAQNYLGWLMTALPLQLLFFLLNKSVKNKVAVWLLLLQFLFFWFLGYFK